MDHPPDFVSLALDVDKEAFIAQCPFPFLLAVNEPEGEAERPSQETILGSVRDLESALPTAGPAIGRPSVYPVRKVAPSNPLSITIGRASTSDIVISDQQVSKTHAQFHAVGALWELSDVGSRNGTWVGHKRLAAHGEGALVQSFDVLSFGHRVYLFLDAGDCWEQLRPLVATLQPSR